MVQQRVCPWWLGYLLINPLRKLRNDPDKILGPYIRSGMSVLDFGSAMGYFSLPIANMVGKSGKVHCFDIQRKMLEKLMVRARKAGVDAVIEPHLVVNDLVGFDELNQSADFALLFAVAHEVPDQEQLFAFLFNKMKAGSLLLFAEPSGHVSRKEFEHSKSTALVAGFTVNQSLSIKGFSSVLLEKKEF